MSVNIIDNNDVYVGYNLAQDCSEEASFFFAKSLDSPIKKLTTTDIEKEFPTLDNFFFDTNFFKSSEEENNIHIKNSYGDEYFVVFKLCNENDAIYLFLTNCHNGWYSHFFELIDKKNNKRIKDGVI